MVFTGTVVAGAIIMSGRTPVSKDLQASNCL